VSLFDTLREPFSGRLRDYFFDSFRPEISEDAFWEVIERLGWWTDVRTRDEVREALERELSLAEHYAVYRRASELVDATRDRLEAARARGDVEVPADLHGDAPYAACAHILGLGREVFERESQDPGALVERARREDTYFDPEWPTRDFLEALSPRERLERASFGEVAAMLRREAAVRVPGDPAGLGDGELVDHPQHGLGVVEIEEHHGYLWLFFPETHLSMRRHDSVAEEVTLYRDGDHGPEFFYAGLGSSTAGVSVYLQQGLLDRTRAYLAEGSERRRYLEPRARPEARAFFEERIERARERGFEERRLPAHTMVTQVFGAGLDGDASLRRRARAEIDRALREHGNGACTHRHVVADRASFFAEVHHLEGARSAVVRRLERALDPEFGALELRVLTFEGCAPVELASIGAGGVETDAASPRIVDATGAPVEDPSPWGEAVPCDTAGEISHMTKLEIVTDPSVGEEARERAEAFVREVEGAMGVSFDGSFEEALARLEEVLGRVEEWPVDAGPVDGGRDELLVGAGCLYGERLLEEVGGAWGRGRMFGSVGERALELGPARLEVWPIAEVRARHERAVQGAGYAESLVERARRLVERAGDEDAAPFFGGDRLYPLRAGEGYFDAGVTADGRQALMAAFYPETFALFFDEDGWLLACATHPPVPDPDDIGEYHGPSPAALRRWQRALGFEPRTIRVRAFTLPDMGVGIEPFTGMDVQFLRDPESEPDPGERARCRARIQRWIEDEAFVLYWGNDLWLDGTGHVTSS
jgi:hypothetical protein